MNLKNNNLKIISSVMSLGQEEIKSEEFIRMSLIDGYQKISSSEVDTNFLKIIVKINKIIKVHFPKRNILSYLPLFEEIYFSKIEVTRESVKENKKEIKLLIERFINSLFNEKLLIKKSKIANISADNFVKNVSRLLDEMPQKSDLHDELVNSRIAAKEKTLRNIIKNIRVNQENLRNIILEKKYREDRYLQLVKFDINNWLDIYGKIPNQKKDLKKNMKLVLKGANIIK